MAAVVMAYGLGRYGSEDTGVYYTCILSLLQLYMRVLPFYKSGAL